MTILFVLTMGFAAAMATIGLLQPVRVPSAAAPAPLSGTR
jgi:hypothetical protein